MRNKRGRPKIDDQIKIVALKLVDNGTKIKEIARLLDVSERTIKYWINGK